MPDVDLLLQGYRLQTDQGSAAFCGVTLVRSTRTILVDVAHTGRRTLLIEKLKERGLRPEDIDLVFLTHAHWDHMLNIDLFTSAEVLISTAEYRYASNPRPSDWATPAYTGAILDRMRIRQVNEGDEIDDGVRMIETPGHSPGSMTLLVDREDGTVAVTGDALPTARSAIEGAPYLVFFDEAVARESARKIRSYAKVLYPGHDRPFRIEGDAVTYLQPTKIHVWTQLEPFAGEVGVTLSAESGSAIEDLRARAAAAAKA